MSVLPQPISAACRLSPGRMLATGLRCDEDQDRWLTVQPGGYRGNPSTRCSLIVINTSYGDNSCLAERSVGTSTKTVHDYLADMREHHFRGPPPHFLSSKSNLAAWVRHEHTLQDYRQRTHPRISDETRQTGAWADLTESDINSEGTDAPMDVKPLRAVVRVVWVRIVELTGDVSL